MSCSDLGLRSQVNQPIHCLAASMQLRRRPISLRMPFG